MNLFAETNSTGKSSNLKLGAPDTDINFFPVLILERSETNLEVKRDNNDYILEGIAAIFGEENNNHRIYEEKEYLPHLEYLIEKIKQGRLVGELDHPEKFDVSLKSISHKIEKLEYVKEHRHVKIRVRLLDTPSGRIAKTLVDAGVPISISSRAAGSVAENKKVKIKKIFTYDLVADPGFEKAQLEKICESANFDLIGERKKSIIGTLDEVSENYGIKNNNVGIYSINENDPLYRKAMEGDRKITGPDMSQYVTVQELNDYSAIIKKEMDGLKEKFKSAPVEETAGTSTATDALAKMDERLNKIEKYTKYLAENLDKNIQYAEYLAENLDKNIEYSKYIAENLDKNISYAEYLAENLDRNISYSEYLAENLDKSITFADYLAENLEKGIAYSEYLGENLDKNISYSEYLAENLDKNISYSEYLAENLDRGISYSEYIAEKLEKNIAYAEYIAENVGGAASIETPKVNETATEAVVVAEKTEEVVIPATEVAAEIIPATEVIPAVVAEVVVPAVEVVKEETQIDEATKYSGLTAQINQLLEIAKNQKAKSKINESKYHFFRFLSEEKREDFNVLDEAKKEKVVEALKDNAYFTEVDVLRKWDAALVEKPDLTPAFLKKIPAEIKPLYEALSLKEKESIIAQSKVHKVETDYQIKTFWKTRPAFASKSVGLIKLNENESITANAAAPSLRGYDNDYMKGVADELAKRFKK